MTLDWIDTAPPPTVMLLPFTPASMVFIPTELISEPSTSSDWLPRIVTAPACPATSSERVRVLFLN